jgi:hypothetical protein
VTSKAITGKVLPPFSAEVRRVLVAEAVLAVIQEFKHGDVIPGTWLDEKLKIDWTLVKDKKSADTIQRAFMEMQLDLAGILLREHGMLLKAVGSGRSYRIVPYEEMPDVTHADGRREIARALNRMTDRAIHTDASKLSGSAKKTRDHILGAAAAIRAFGERQLPGRGRVPSDDETE